MKNNKKLALYILEHFDVIGVLDIDGVLTVKLPGAMNCLDIMVKLNEAGFTFGEIASIEFTTN